MKLDLTSAVTPAAGDMLPMGVRAWATTKADAEDLTIVTYPIL